MENLLTLALEAHNGERNHHRRYEIRVGRDLFAIWTLTIRYGRAGNTLREERFSSAHKSELQAISSDRLRRRSNAKRRIGARYEVVELNCNEDSEVVEWFPESDLVPFLPAK